MRQLQCKGIAVAPWRSAAMVGSAATFVRDTGAPVAHTCTARAQVLQMSTCVIVPVLDEMHS